MKIIRSYISGFRRAFISKKIITIIYGVTLLLGLILASVFNSTIAGAYGSRPELYKLLNDFDFKVYTDFLNSAGDRVYPLINQMLWFGIFYLFFTVFFAGGVLKYFEVPGIKSKAQTFFAGCAKYFSRFLRLGIYVLLIQAVVFAVIAVPFAGIFNNALESSTEPSLFTVVLIWFGLHIFLFVLISIVSDYAKIILVKEDSGKVWRALWNGFRFTIKKFYITYPLYILLLIIPVVLTFVYLWIDASLGMKSILTVFVMALIQQIFIWTRVYCKVWILGSEYEYFSGHLRETMQPLLTQEMLINETL